MAKRRRRAANSARSRTSPSRTEPTNVPRNLTHRPVNELRTVEQACWAYGRLLNELRFCWHAAWITKVPITRSGSIIAELRLVVREIATMPARRDQNAAAVDQAERSWEFQFGSSSHDELLFSEDRQLADERDRDATPDEQLITERCRFLTGFVDELLSGIQSVVETDLSQNQQEIIRLGMLVDEAIHPQPVYRYMHFDRESGEATTPSSWEHPNGVERACRRGLPMLPVTVPNDWPDQRWLQEVEQRMLQFGLSPIELPDVHSRSTTATRSRLIEVIEGLLQGLLANRDETHAGSREDRIGQRGVTYTLSDAVQIAAERLRLSLDPLQRSITGNGCVITVAPRNFELLLHFLERGEESTRIVWFQNNWSRFGRVPECRPGTVHDAVARLQLDLVPIGLFVERVSGGGAYFLRANSTPPTNENQQA